jgi:hypothetical protein
MQASPFISAAAIASALLMAGCAPSDPVEVLVEITTDLGCSMLNTVAIDLIDGTDAQRQVASTDACADGRIGSLVFLPGGKESSSATGEVSDETFGIIVVAGVNIPTAECEANGYLGCMIARRRVSFGSGTTVVPIELRANCIGVACSPTTSCTSDGECASGDQN